MQLITVSDIFGKTRHLENLLGHLSDAYDSIELIDPYGGARLDFRSEQEAYAYFQTNIGLEKYRDLLLDRFQDTQQAETHLLGFSIGASAIWLLSGVLDCHKNTRATCFYSSQIRNYLEIRPRLNIDLYFPENEPTFDVEAIMKELAQTPNVQCYQTGYLHGFMNKLSANYNKNGYHHFVEILKNQKAAG